MALLQFDNIRIAGIAAGVPKHMEPTRSNTDKYDDEAFIESVGVKETRISDEFTTGDLGMAAAERLITDLGWEKSDIELIVVVTQSQDYPLPATACVLHGKMGLKRGCLAFDISLGCSGWVYGLSVVMSMIGNGSIKKAILIVGDAKKPYIGERDYLFGHAATATAVEFKEGASPIYFDLGTDGTGYDAIIRYGGGARNPVNPHSLELHMDEDGRMRHELTPVMKGMDVFAFGITTVPKSIKNVLKLSGTSIEEVDAVVFHQANIKMLETIRKKMKLPAEKVPYGLIMFGNTSSASIPLAIVTNLRGSLKEKEAIIVACGFGVGLSWGSIEFKTDKDFIISKLQELGDE